MSKAIKTIEQIVMEHQIQKNRPAVRKRIRIPGELWDRVQPMIQESGLNETDFFIALLERLTGGKKDVCDD